MSCRTTVSGLALGLLVLSSGSAWAVAQPWVPDPNANVGPGPASYNKWEAIEAPAESGAVCGGGTPYRFFVNRTTNTANKNKTVVVFEGGGACWDQNACLMKNGVLGATNYNGIASNHMSTFGLATPFTQRLPLLQKVQTQSWNIVYAPYCTGDVHTGNKFTVYNDADPSNPTPYYHHGFQNIQLIANWMGKYFSNQDKLLVTGFSAGGSGATVAYSFIRLAAKPKQGALMADSGPLFQVNRNDSPDVSPSVFLHNKIRTAWGLEGDDGIASRLLVTFPGTGDINNLGSQTTALAKIFPNDRFGQAVFQCDGVYSAFSYASFYPEIAAAPLGPKRDAMLKEKWVKELGTWVNAMKPYPNMGYYIPYGRDFIKSHTLTTGSFAGTAIKEANLADVGVFIDNVLDPSQPLIRAYETQRTVQNSGGIALFSWINNAIYALFGL